MKLMKHTKHANYKNFLNHITKELNDEFAHIGIPKEGESTNRFDIRFTWDLDLPEISPTFRCYANLFRDRLQALNPTAMTPIRLKEAVLQEEGNGEVIWYCDVVSEDYEVLDKVNKTTKKIYSGKYIYQDICYFRDQGKLSPIQAFKLMDYLEHSTDPAILLEKLRRLKQTNG